MADTEGSFDTTASTSSATTGKTSEITYAEDPLDNAFIHCLIRTVEQHIVLDKLRADEAEARQKVQDSQLALDDYMETAQRLRGCHEPAVESLADYRELEADAAMDELRRWTQKLDRAETALAASKPKRKRLLRELFRGAERFIYQVTMLDADYEPLGFDGAFLRGLARLRASAVMTDAFERSYASVRERVVDSQRRVAALAADPTATEAEKAASLERRKRALAAARDGRRAHQVRQENQVTREREFFTGEAYSVLLLARVLPQQATATPPSSHASLAKIDGPPADLRMGHSEDASSPQPQCQALEEARSVAANIEAKLAHLRQQYVLHLGEYLMLHPAFTKRDFDEEYEEDHNGKSIAVLEAELLAEMLQADAVCSLAWREALKANVTDLPPSPVEYAAQSDDGYASSMDQDARARKQQRTEDVQQSVRQWGKSVARSGSPLSPSAPAVKTFAGKRKLPHGGFPHREIDDEDHDDSRSRRTLERAYRNKDDYNERFLLQDTKRLRTELPRRRWCQVM